MGLCTREVVCEGRLSEKRGVSGAVNMRTGVEMVFESLEGEEVDLFLPADVSEINSIGSIGCKLT